MPTPSLLALSQNRLRHGDPKWSKTALSAGKRSDAVKAAFVIGERGAFWSLTRFDDMPDENDVIAGFEVMIAQTFQMGNADFDQGSAQQDGRSEENTSELQLLMRISYIVLCLKNKTHQYTKLST